MLAKQLEDAIDDDLELLKPALQSSQRTSLVEELAEAAQKSMSSKPVDLYIQRSRALKNVFEELKDNKLTSSKISVEFVGEPAADTGGPTRELFSIVFKQLIDSRITRGTFPIMSFMHDQSALIEGDYKSFGQLVALSLLNGASGPHFLLPSLAHFVLGSQDEQEATTLIQQLPLENHNIKEKLEALYSCDDPNKWNELILNFDERFDMGINTACVPFENKEMLIKATVKHIMVSSVAEEIYSFQDGLSLFNVLSILKKYPDEAFKELTHIEITEDDVRKPFKPSFSLKGSTKRASEELVAYNFNQFLKKCRQGAVTRTVVDLDGILGDSGSPLSENTLSLNLNDVLQFITGSRYPLPGGIQGSMLFQHEALPGTRVKANTCANTITFQVNERYSAEDSTIFTSNLADDIFDGPGYGYV